MARGAAAGPAAAAVRHMQCQRRHRGGTVGGRYPPGCDHRRQYKDSYRPSWALCQCGSRRAHHTTMQALRLLPRLLRLALVLLQASLPPPGPLCHLSTGPLRHLDTQPTCSSPSSHRPRGCRGRRLTVCVRLQVLPQRAASSRWMGSSRLLTGLKASDVTGLRVAFPDSTCTNQSTTAVRDSHHHRTDPCTGGAAADLSLRLRSAGLGVPEGEVMEALVLEALCLVAQGVAEPYSCVGEKCVLLGLR